MITFTIKQYAEHWYWCAEWPTQRGVEHLESYGHDTAKDAETDLADFIEKVRRSDYVIDGGAG